MSANIEQIVAAQRGGHAFTGPEVSAAILSAKAALRENPTAARIESLKNGMLLVLLRGNVFSIGLNKEECQELLLVAAEKERDDIAGAVRDAVQAERLRMLRILVGCAVPLEVANALPSIDYTKEFYAEVASAVAAIRAEVSSYYEDNPCEATTLDDATIERLAQLNEESAKVRERVANLRSLVQPGVEGGKT